MMCLGTIDSVSCSLESCRGHRRC